MRYVKIPKPRTVRLPGGAPAATLTLYQLLAETVWTAATWRQDEAHAAAFARVVDAFHADDDAELEPGQVVELSDADYEKLANVVRGVQVQNPITSAAVTRLFGAIVSAGCEPPVGARAAVEAPS